jgi:phenylacetic acid degradation operon negative regulatory protein
VTTSSATGSQAGSDTFAAPPRALIVTIYGLYARESGGWFSIAALIRLMAELGIEEPAVRSAISRLKLRGLLESRREGGAVGYGLSSRGREILAEGDRRIFHRTAASAAEGWLLAVFSVPEHERARRHALRSRLAWLGFGTVAAGVWIAPGQLAGETRDVLAADGLAGYVTLFTAGYLAFGDVREKIAEWWDLDRLGQLYDAFTESAGPVLANWQGSAGRDGAGRDGAGRDGAGRDEASDAARAFADYVRVLTAWRRLPFLDPGLPPDLLPADWRGSRAAGLFGQLQAILADSARQHVLTVIGQPG